MADVLVAEAQRGRARCRVVDDADSIAVHHRIRRAVFVDEQHLFDGDDRDGHDDDPRTIKVVGLYDDRSGGTVRLFSLDVNGECWQGDRLAVLPPFRRHGLGIPLVGFAVESAGRLGGRLMTAHIQVANVAFFEHLGWRGDGAIEQYVGVAHQPMAIDLFPPEAVER